MARSAAAIDRRGRQERESMRAGVWLRSIQSLKGSFISVHSCGFFGAVAPFRGFA
jgi:hypothetical protein